MKFNSRNGERVKHRIKLTEYNMEDGGGKGERKKLIIIKNQTERDKQPVGDVEMKPVVNNNH